MTEEQELRLKKLLDDLEWLRDRVSTTMDLNKQWIYSKEEIDAIEKVMSAIGDCL